MAPKITRGDSNGSRSSGGSVVLATATSDKPGLNILNQASDITLNANNNSFDPAQVPVVATVVADPQPQPHSAASEAMGTFASALAQTSTVSSSSMGGGGGVSPPPHAGVVERPAAPSQRRPPPASSFQPHRITQHHQQDPQLPQPGEGYPGKREHHHNLYSGNDKKTSLMDGRVPATKRDGRKLFVGGLPNGVTDKSFLQFFQHYGEVIDSVVLLDRRTRRSRGFGFVTFADPNVAASLLTKIHGRTGVVNIMGRNCEVKASEPKTLEAARLAHSTINLPVPAPRHQGNAHNPYHRTPSCMMDPMQHQHMTFSAGGGGGEAPVPLQVNPTIAMPPNFNYYGTVNGAESATSGGNGGGGGGGGEGGGGEGVPIYSHSTMTTARVPPAMVSAAAEGGASPAKIYIQNNFYTLPPGADVPPACVANATLTPEALVQAQQREFTAALGRMAVAGGTAYAPMYSGSALQPLYPGPSNGEVMEGARRGRPQHHPPQQPQQKQPQRKTRGPPYAS